MSSRAILWNRFVLRTELIFTLRIACHVKPIQNMTTAAARNQCICLYWKLYCVWKRSSSKLESFPFIEKRDGMCLCFCPNLSTPLLLYYWKHNGCPLAGLMSHRNQIDWKQIFLVLWANYLFTILLIFDGMWFQSIIEAIIIRPTATTNNTFSVMLR